MERECPLCDGALDGDGPYHPDCEAEYRRRRALMLCMLCGKEGVRGSDLWCTACTSGGNPVPRGYPGGAARLHPKTV